MFEDDDGDDDETLMVEGILESLDGFPVPREVTPWPNGERCIAVTQWIPTPPEA